MDGRNHGQTDRENIGPLNAPSYVMKHESGQNSFRRTDGQIGKPPCSQYECIGTLLIDHPRFFNIIFGIIFASAMFYFEGAASQLGWPQQTCGPRLGKLTPQWWCRQVPTFRWTHSSPIAAFRQVRGGSAVASKS